MRLATIREAGEIRLCTFHRNEWIDITDAVRSITGGSGEDDMIALIRKGPSALQQLDRIIQEDASNGLRPIAIDSVEWLPPVVAPTKIVCIALNNRALDAVKLRAPTDHPAFFVKTQNALLGHQQPLRLRPSFGLTHPEPELAVIIGRKLTDASPAEALNSIFGFTIMNDVTSVGMREEDSFTFRYYLPGPAGGELIAAEGHTTYPGRYKGSDGFAPLGPYIVTRDEIDDPDALDIRCWLGDRLVADDNTRNYVWSVGDGLSHISRSVTLMPGDVVSMGTAVGAETDAPGKSKKYPVSQANLVGHRGAVSIEITGLGRLSNPTVTA